MLQYLCGQMSEHQGSEEEEREEGEVVFVCNPMSEWHWYLTAPFIMTYWSHDMWYSWCVTWRSSRPTAQLSPLVSQISCSAASSWACSSNVVCAYGQCTSCHGNVMPYMGHISQRSCYWTSWMLHSEHSYIRSKVILFIAISGQRSINCLVWCPHRHWRLSSLPFHSYPLHMQHCHR